MMPDPLTPAEIDELRKNYGYLFHLTPYHCGSRMVGEGDMLNTIEALRNQLTEAVAVIKHTWENGHTDCCGSILDRSPFAEIADGIVDEDDEDSDE